MKPSATPKAPAAPARMVAPSPKKNGAGAAAPAPVLLEVIAELEAMGRRCAELSDRLRLHGAVESITGRRQHAVAILARVAKHFGYTAEEMRGRCRWAHRATARHICVFIIQKQTHLSTTEIAALMNRADHTTILHSLGRARDLIDTDADIRQQVDILQQEP